MSQNDPEIVCKNCLYWHAPQDMDPPAAPGYTLGICKRYPMWVDRNTYDWCGEMRHASSKKA